MDKKLFNFIKTPGEDVSFVKKQTKFYLSIFKHNRIGDWFPSWNWACFFASFFGLGFVWLFYRKMYFYGILIGLVGVTFFELIRMNLGLLLMASFGFVIGKIVMWILKIMWVFIFTLYGNSLYGKHIKNQIEKGKTESGIDAYTPLIIASLLVINLIYTFKKMVQSGMLEATNMQELMEQLVKINAG